MKLRAAADNAGFSRRYKAPYACQQHPRSSEVFSKAAKHLAAVLVDFVS
jgi:hypothetical protein